MSTLLLLIALFYTYTTACSLFLGEVRMHAPSGYYPGAKQTTAFKSKIPFGLFRVEWMIELISDPRENRLGRVDYLTSLYSGGRRLAGQKKTLWALPEEKRLNVYK